MRDLIIWVGVRRQHQWCILFAELKLVINSVRLIFEKSSSRWRTAGEKMKIDVKYMFSVKSQNAEANLKFDKFCV